MECSVGSSAQYRKIINKICPAKHRNATRQPVNPKPEIECFSSSQEMLPDERKILITTPTTTVLIPSWIMVFLETSLLFEREMGVLRV